MTRSFAMARFDLAWPLAAVLATILSLIVLSAASLMQGTGPWAPLNATTHAFYGAEAAEFHGLDLVHTGLGLVIHMASCAFWAAVAVGWIRMISRLQSPQILRQTTGLAWLVGLGTAALALLVDYALMPGRLTPGWELVLPPIALLIGLAALGVGLALGLILARKIAKEGRATRP